MEGVTTHLRRVVHSRGLDRGGGEGYSRARIVSPTSIYRTTVDRAIVCYVELGTRRELIAKFSFREHPDQRR